ncbi:MAG: hypothetical protein RIC95_09235 [Vicingaceae bacterium]
MISSFFKSGRNKRFNFSPRYYDADKEAFQNRYAQIEAEMKGKSTLSHAGGRSLRDRWEANKNNSSFSKKSNVRLLFIIALLCGLCYVILYL